MLNNVRIAFGTDMGLLAPTALALDSVLRTTPALSNIDVLGVSLTNKAERLLSHIAEKSEVCINFHFLKSSAFSSAGAKSRHVPKAALARLYIPHLIDGRVLYIDGDTLVQRDVEEAFHLPMNGKLIGGVRDFSCLKRECKYKSKNKFWAERCGIKGIVHPYPIESYINSGVLLMDCAAIQREPNLADDMLRFDRAKRYKTVDQDYINELFKGRIMYINPSWNSSWGRQNLQANWARKMGYSGSEVQPESARILHFHGAEKPWGKLPRDRWKRSFSAVLAYKMALRNFRKRFPDLPFN